MPSFAGAETEAVALERDGPDVRYIARNPGDIAPAGQLGLFLAIRVTIRVRRVPDRKPSHMPDLT